ncbi:hypothetical protein RvY_00245, partial [Ramazzottius varieornatus]
LVLQSKIPCCFYRSHGSSANKLDMLIFPCGARLRVSSIKMCATWKKTKRTRRDRFPKWRTFPVLLAGSVRHWGLKTARVSFVVFPTSFMACGGLPSTMTEQLLLASPTALNASQVYVPKSSGKISAICSLKTLPSWTYLKSSPVLISLSLCSQTASTAGSPLISHSNVRASPSLQLALCRWRVKTGADSPSAGAALGTLGEDGVAAGVEAGSEAETSPASSTASADS